MQTLIDKIAVAGTTNIPTAGFKTLLLLVTHTATGAANYVGSAAEGKALAAAFSATVADNASGTNAVALGAQYIKARTQAGSKNAFVEIVLTAAYVTAITAPVGITKGSALLTGPSNSQV